MRRLRSSRPLALIGLAVVVFSAVLPALGFGDLVAVLVPLWVIIPAVLVVLIRRAARRSADHPLALRSLALFRAPPLVLPAF